MAERDQKSDGTEERRAILIVDDEPALLRSLRRQLSSWGYTVVAVERASEALSVCRTALPCLVITDLLMPEMDGFELARKLQEEYGESSPPLTVLTGDAHRRTPEGNPAVISVLIKPTPPRVLRQLVDRVCSEHRRPPYIIPDDNSGPLDVA